MLDVVLVVRCVVLMFLVSVCLVFYGKGLGVGWVCGDCGGIWVIGGREKGDDLLKLRLGLMVFVVVWVVVLVVVIVVGDLCMSLLIEVLVMVGLVLIVGFGRVGLLRLIRCGSMMIEVVKELYCVLVGGLLVGVF